MKVDAESLLEFQATLLSHERFDEAATAFATELALKLGFDRVAIGLIEHDLVTVKAVSHSADVQAKYEANRAIVAAMEEAIEQAAVISSPEITVGVPRITLAHKALARNTGNHVCTIPLTRNEEIYGALTFERSADNKIEQEELDDCEHIASLIGPVLLLKWSEEHPWHLRIRRGWAGRQKKAFQNNPAFRIGLYVGAAIILALLFVPVQYNVSAPAHLEGSIQRSMVAPENGFLQQAYVRPGDKVKAGQLLADLADQELKLEKRKWESELAQHDNAYGASLAEADRSELVINQSKAEEARTELELTEQKIARSHILAPFDGIIIKGDLRQSLGAPVQRGDVLLTIAPVDAFRLMIEVDEREVAAIRPLQTGRVALVSMPDKSLAFKVERITPVATTKDGRNFFDVEATLLRKSSSDLRPGLEGVAKINAGQRSLAWIWTHRILDTIRMAFWSWGIF
ncbi:MAG TPA: efflux RND transporter periplasmic adaptor subunit [Methylophilaceae bacterium]